MAFVHHAKVVESAGRVGSCPDRHHANSAGIYDAVAFSSTYGACLVHTLCTLLVSTCLSGVQVNLARSLDGDKGHAIASQSYTAAAVTDVYDARKLSGV